MNNTAEQRTADHLPPVDRVLAQLDHPRRMGREWVARCPTHDDRDPSLSVREGRDGTVLLLCRAGCETKSVLAALGLEWRDLFPADWRRDAEQSVRFARITVRREERQLADRLRQERENWQGPPADYIEKHPLAERLAVVLRHAVDSGHLDHVDVEHIGRALTDHVDAEHLRHQAKAATDAAEAAWAALRGSVA